MQVIYDFCNDADDDIYRKELIVMTHGWPSSCVKLYGGKEQTEQNIYKIVDTHPF